MPLSRHDRTVREYRVAMGSRYNHVDGGAPEWRIVRRAGREWETFDQLPEGVKDAVLDYAQRGLEYPDPDIAAVAMAWARRERSARMRLVKGAIGPPLLLVAAVTLDNASLAEAWRDRRTARLLVKIGRSKSS